MTEEPPAEEPPAGQPLAEQQAALVAALVAGGPVPDGVDASRVEATREALLRKRSGEVAAHWPQLAAALGPRWPQTFAGWARGRAPAGAWADGLALAAALEAEGRLPQAAREEYRRAVSATRRPAPQDPQDLGAGRPARGVRRLLRWRPARR